MLIQLCTAMQYTGNKKTPHFTYLTDSDCPELTTVFNGSMKWRRCGRAKKKYSFTLYFHWCAVI